MQPQQPLLYLASPGVFRADAQEHYAELKKLCRRYGMEGLSPLDCEVGPLGRPRATSIYWQNLQKIEQAHILMADLNPFRGDEPDSGTAFEVGYAHALDKILYGYMDDTRPLVEKLGKADRNGMRVEDFGYAVNLMLAIPVRLVQGTAEDCLREIQKAKHLYSIPHRRAIRPEHYTEDLLPSRTWELSRWMPSKSECA